MSEKNAFRELAKKKNVLISNREERSSAISDMFLSGSMYRSCNDFFCYVSMENEPNTAGVIARLFEDKKNVFVPRCRETAGDMEAVRIFSFDDLIPGKFGTLEPKRKYPATDKKFFDVIIMPCVACSEDMVRLGHGGGYYDRFLEEKDGYKIVFCFDDLLFKSLPKDKSDVNVDMIITEKRLIIGNGV